jgi:stage II sporulation protein D
MRAVVSRTPGSSSTTRILGTALSLRHRGADKQTMGHRSALSAALVASAVTLAGCVGGAPPPVVTPSPVLAPRSATIRVQVREGNATVVRTVPLEEYVAATILSEFDPPSANEQMVERMYEVQAVISRTYALSQRSRHIADDFDVCSTTRCQLYEPTRLRTSKWATTARAAAGRTAGEALWYADAPAEAIFHADCGGWRSNAAEVWGGSSPPYLAGGPDDGPASAAHAQWTFDQPVDAVRDALNADERTMVGGTFEQMQVVTRDHAGRVSEILLRGTRDVAVRGDVLRDVLARTFGVKSVRSTLFTVMRTHGRIVMSGKGFGHGVGLCQAGALARLQAGATPEQVLAFYYPGTRLRRSL